MSDTTRRNAHDQPFTATDTCLRPHRLCVDRGDWSIQPAWPRLPAHTRGTTTHRDEQGRPLWIHVDDETGA